MRKGKKNVNSLNSGSAQHGHPFSKNHLLASTISNILNNGYRTKQYTWRFYHTNNIFRLYQTDNRFMGVIKPTMSLKTLLHKLHLHKTYVLLLQGV